MRWHRWLRIFTDLSSMSTGSFQATLCHFLGVAKQKMVEFFSFFLSEVFCHFENLFKSILIKYFMFKLFTLLPLCPWMGSGGVLDLLLQDTKWLQTQTGTTVRHRLKPLGQRQLIKTTGLVISYCYPYWLLRTTVISHCTMWLLHSNTWHHTTIRPTAALRLFVCIFIKTVIILWAKIRWGIVN